jgi:hypothetical protein
MPMTVIHPENSNEALSQYLYSFSGDTGFQNPKSDALQPLRMNINEADPPPVENSKQYLIINDSNSKRYRFSELISANERHLSGKGIMQSIK